MAQLDPNIILQAQAPQINPLQTYAQAQGIKNAQAQNQLLQNENQQYQAKVRAGQLWQQAGGDPTKFNALLNGDPTAAPYAMEASQQGLQNAREATALDTDKLNNAYLHLTKAGEAAGTLLQKPGLLSMDDFHKGAVGVISDNDYPTAMKSDLIGDAVKISSGLQSQIDAAGAQNDPKKTDQIIRQGLQGILTMTDNGRAMLQASYGSPQAINAGPVTKIVRTGVNGQVQDLGGVVNGVSPEYAGEQVPTMQDGVPGTVSKGSLSGPTGGLSAQAPGTLLTPDGQPANGGPSAPPQAPHFNPTGLPVGAAQAITEQATASAQQASAAQAVASESPSRRALIKNLKDVSDTFDGGPMSAAALKAQQWLEEVHLLPKGSVASQEDFNKNAYQVVQTQGATLGHTNMQTEIGLSSNPNQSMSKEGRARVIALMLGNEDAIQGRNAVWQGLLSSGKAQPQDWGKFTSDFNKRFDPRAFQYQYMTPQQQKMMLDGMAAAERAKFLGGDGRGGPGSSLDFAKWVRNQAGE